MLNLRRRSLLAMMAGLATATFGAFGDSALAAEEKTLTAVMSGNLKALDPSVSTAQITRTHGFMVYDTLLGMDAQYQPQPQMADYTVSDDKLTYTFTLRDGLKWHDGSDVTAEDCIASLNRWASYDAGGARLFKQVASLAATSDKTFEIRLSAPFGQILALLAKPSPIPPFMMPKRLAETPKGQQLPEQIGSGPFKFVADEFRPGDKVVYVKNTDYVPRPEPSSWTAGGKVVNVDKVIWQSMPDMQTTLNALQNGDVDFVEQVPLDLLPVIEAMPDVDTGMVRPLGMQVVARMNHTLAPFDNVDVRRAAMLVLNQEELMQAAIGDPQYYHLCASIYGCSTPLASDAGAEWLYGDGRKEKAKELLAKSGYDGTPVIMLQQTELDAFKPQPLLAAQRMREIGFNVEVQSMDWQTHLQRQYSRAPVADGGWNMLFSAWGITGIWDPLASTVIDASGSSQAWSGWPKDDELEQMRTEFSVETDPVKQKEIAEKIQARVLDQVNYVPLGEYDIIAAWNDRVEDIPQGPLTLFWQVELAK
ncbi:ABC transporter substrate-binding protein [Martelella sp. HB161492]|uniref:ABC transporter substrate-binding protein n=1 Tax=Martelella sp. HB161492 TaxID=2720726 RepID=UPI0015912C50|nr:ABC transporter substrate-binding protein [Martelella sp. HB161492]